MNIKVLNFEWDHGNVDKNIVKHDLYPTEIEEAFFNKPNKTLIGRDDRYYLLGRTNAGRYLFIVFIIKSKIIRVISARDMSKDEKRKYFKK
jgi:uncharacterized protein